MNLGWLSELPSLLKDYKAGEVFNADETELFFQRLANKTAAFKGEECHGGKKSKFRVTVFLPANQSGKEKLPPLMIGRSKKPRCFVKIKSFPIMYKSDQKAWMTRGNFW
ncbi:Tigger transposable element-derived protein 6 [Araneus ventricosus]|uniref:Tigger transposable element-derived protein 6 n=1 Tax=Araneus ventricosus TaxID=182803 RepID=A0A4Y2KP23_ARAVE|nr:Tigger transposable element-derived protein 6 [Araneus ventricosus]